MHNAYGSTSIHIKYNTPTYTCNQFGLKSWMKQNFQGRSWMHGIYIRGVQSRIWEIDATVPKVREWIVDTICLYGVPSHRKLFFARYY